MATNSNFMVKVTDAKLPDIQKALQQAGVNVRSIIEVFKEEGRAEAAEKSEEVKNGREKKIKAYSAQTLR